MSDTQALPPVRVQRQTRSGIIAMTLGLAAVAGVALMPFWASGG